MFNFLLCNYYHIISWLFCLHRYITLKCYLCWISAYELWFKQILFELDSVREIFISGHVSYIVFWGELFLCNHVLFFTFVPLNSDESDVSCQCWRFNSCIKSLNTWTSNTIITEKTSSDQTQVLFWFIQSDRLQFSCEKIKHFLHHLGSCLKLNFLPPPAETHRAEEIMM